MGKCWGITKRVRFCRINAGEKWLCQKHAAQPRYFLVVALTGIFFSCIAGLMLNAWENKDKQLKDEEAEARLEFFIERSKPLMGGSVILVLKEPFSPNDLGHFRFMAQILNLLEPDPHPSLWIAGRDAYMVKSINGVSYRLMGTKSLVWSQNPDEQIQNTVLSFSEATTTQLNAGGHLYKRGPFKTISDLEDRALTIFVTKPLYKQIAGIYLTANNLIISGAEAEHFVPLDSSPLVDWPEPLTEDEANIPWIAVMLKIHDPPDWMVPELARTSFKINFSEYTPRRLGKQ